MKTWLAEDVKPISPELEICDVDDSVTGQMELEENGDKDEEVLNCGDCRDAASYFGGEEAVKKDRGEDG